MGKYAPYLGSRLFRILITLAGLQGQSSQASQSACVVSSYIAHGTSAQGDGYEPAGGCWGLQRGSRAFPVGKYMRL